MNSTFVLIKRDEFVAHYVVEFGGAAGWHRGGEGRLLLEGTAV